MNLGKILLILVLALINKAFTGNVRHNLAPLELNGDPRNNLGQMELNKYPTNRWGIWDSWNWIKGQIDEAKNWIEWKKGEIYNLVEEGKKTKDWIGSKVKEVKEDASKILEDVKEEAEKWKKEATNLLMSALEEHFNLEKLKFKKCYQSAVDATRALKDSQSTIVQQFTDQMENLKNGKKTEVFNALRSIADETGDTFKNFEKAAGCLAEKFGYKAYSISASLAKGVGVTAEKEMGIAKSFGKEDMMLFSSKCKGLKSDAHIAKSLTIALWKNIDSIEGTVYPATYGLSLPSVPPMPSVEAALGSVIAKKTDWSPLTPWRVEKIGTEISVSLGAGVSPVDISFSQCTTKVVYKANDEENDVTTLEWSQYQNCLQKDSSKNWIEFRKCLMGDIPSACPEGYKLKPGDIEGWGQDFQATDEDTISGCAKRCNEQPDCCSFEYSKSEGGCNLNKGCTPTGGVYKDYSFCAKETGGK